MRWFEIGFGVLMVFLVVTSYIAGLLKGRSDQPELFDAEDWDDEAFKVLRGKRG